MSNEPTADPYPAGENRAVSAAGESPVLLHVWEVDPEREGVAAQRLTEMIGEVATEPGFVSARLLESADRRSIAAIVEMRSVEDRRRLEQLPVVRDTLHHLDSSFSLVVKLYHDVET
jgi:hypothetical protein